MCANKSATANQQQVEKKKKDLTKRTKEFEKRNPHKHFFKHFFDCFFFVVLFYFL
jgi:hypothetical protein